MDPNDLKPAPGPLRLVQEFVNTRSNLRGIDLLEDVEGTARWLAGHGLLADGAAEVSETDRGALISFREGLRKILEIHNAGARTEEEATAVSTELDDLAGTALLRVAFDLSGEPRLRPVEGKAKGIETGMALMLAAVLRSSVEDAWERLKACRNEACGWAFYDNSKNRSGTWCDMQTCGARHKMRVYRERKSG